MGLEIAEGKWGKLRGVSPENSAGGATFPGAGNPEQFPEEAQPLDDFQEQNRGCMGQNPQKGLVKAAHGQQPGQQG